MVAAGSDRRAGGQRDAPRHRDLWRIWIVLALLASILIIERQSPPTHKPWEQSQLLQAFSGIRMA
jgi:hypothetical protein